MFSRYFSSDEAGEGEICLVDFLFIIDSNIIKYCLLRIISVWIWGKIVLLFKIKIPIIYLEKILKRDLVFIDAPGEGNPSTRN